MTKKKRRIILAVLTVIGLAVLLYPTFSNLWNLHRANSLKTSYQKNLEKAGPSEREAMLKKARVYNQALVGTPVPDSFIMKEGKRDQDYESLLNPGKNGVMGTVEVPCIKVSLPIFHYTTEKVLKQGAGHLTGSSLPVGGKGTHSVIVAHRGLPTAKLFTDLDRVKKGDRFYLDVVGKKLAYEVDSILVVKPRNTKSLLIRKDKDYCTLVTCTPYAVNTHRLLVRGHRVPYSDKQYNKDRHENAWPTFIQILLRVLCVAAGILIAYLIVRFTDKRRKNKKHGSSK